MVGSELLELQELRLSQKGRERVVERVLKTHGELTSSDEPLMVTQRTNRVARQRLVGPVIGDSQRVRHCLTEWHAERAVPGAHPGAHPHGGTHAVLGHGARWIDDEHRCTRVAAGPEARQHIDPCLAVHRCVDDRTMRARRQGALGGGVHVDDGCSRDQTYERLVQGGRRRGFIGNARHCERLTSFGHCTHGPSRQCLPARLGDDTFRRMLSPTSNLRAELAAAVDDYQVHGNAAELQARLRTVAESTTPDALVAAVEPYRDIPEVAAPIYEAIVSAQPTNARALVILANAYWLAGRGPDVVGALANRAIAADAANRGGWHLWALSESDPRQRMTRWQQVVTRFPSDDLARAALADNAASVAGAEQDHDALDLAIDMYEQLLRTATTDAQRHALTTALTSLKGWKL